MKREPFQPSDKLYRLNVSRLDPYKGQERGVLYADTFDDAGTMIKLLTSQYDCDVDLWRKEGGKWEYIMSYDSWPY